MPYNGKGRKGRKRRISVTDATDAGAVTCRDLRIAIATHWASKYLYELAARIPIHPMALSMNLNGHVALKPELARRILDIVEHEGAAAPRRNAPSTAAGH